MATEKKTGDKSALAKAKSQAVNRKDAPQKKKGGLREYLRGVKIETKKVVWPTRQELVSYTITVLIACVFFGLLIWGLDSAFLAGIKEVLSIGA
jgi:preprotein translocase subunit SecE